MFYYPRPSGDRRSASFRGRAIWRWTWYWVADKISILLVRARLRLQPRTYAWATGRMGLTSDRGGARKERPQEHVDLLACDLLRGTLPCVVINGHHPIHPPQQKDCRVPRGRGDAPRSSQHHISIGSLVRQSDYRLPSDQQRRSRVMLDAWAVITWSCPKSYLSWRPQGYLPPGTFQER